MGACLLASLCFPTRQCTLNTHEGTGAAAGRPCGLCTLCPPPPRAWGVPGSAGAIGRVCILSLNHSDPHLARKGSINANYSF